MVVVKIIIIIIYNKWSNNAVTAFRTYTLCISESRRPPAETTARGAFKNRHGSTSPAEAMHFVLLWCPPKMC